MVSLKTSLALAFTLAFAPHSVLAAAQCEALFAAKSAAYTGAIPWAQLSTPAVRSRLALELKEKDVPAFVKDSSRGALPVILVNDATQERLSGFMKKTIGVQIVLQPDDPRSDHGLLRIGGVALQSKTDAGVKTETNLQVDWAPPDLRDTVSELHSTGFAWKDLNELMKKAAAKGGYKKVTIELTYPASDRQRRDLEYYHRVRRAALIAVHTPNWEGVMRPDVPNRIPRDVCHEDCFDVSRGRKFEPMSKFIEAQMETAGLVNFPEYLKRADVRRFLSRARSVVMSANPWDAATFDHALVARDSRALAAGQKILPPQLVSASTADVETFLNSVVAYDALQKARSLYEALEINADIFPRYNLDNPHLAAVLIYAPNAETPRFRDASFFAPGKFQHAGWGEDIDSTSPYLDQRPLR